MTIEVFIMLLYVFTMANMLIVESVKKMFDDKYNISYNLVAVISGLIVGTIGTILFYQLSNIGFTMSNIVCSFLMGIASALSSMVGFDKVKQLILQLK